jgi:hypothetical protein
MESNFDLYRLNFDVVALIIAWTGILAPPALRASQGE